MTGGEQDEEESFFPAAKTAEVLRHTIELLPQPQDNADEYCA